MIFSCFACSKALASIVGPILAGSLRDETNVKSACACAASKIRLTSADGAYGFARMTIFVGTAMLATSAGSIGSALIRRRLK